jgi:multidrug transporter EmrE-like cation transporter
VWVKWLPLFLLAALLETVGQLSFKKAATEHRTVSGLRYYLRLAVDRLVFVGIAVYAVEMLIWLYLLAHIPLSIAFPLAGIQQLVILSASRLYLREQVNRIELFGAVLIAAGLLTIARSS